MKRRLFFLLEKLEIKRSERIAISTLLIVLVMLSGLTTYFEPEANYSEKKYEELEEVFMEKSKQIKAEEDLIMARYEPTREVPVAMSVRASQNTILEVADTTEEESGVVSVININTASNSMLQELPGVGPAYAERIISWRKENGAFTSKDQLLEIKGIGEKRLARIKPLITL